MNNKVYKWGWGWRSMRNSLKTTLKALGLVLGATVALFLANVYQADPMSTNKGPTRTKAERVADGLERAGNFIRGNGSKEVEKFWAEIASWPEPVRCLAESTDYIDRDIDEDGINEQIYFPRDKEGKCKRAYIFHRGKRSLNIPPEKRAEPLFDYNIFCFDLDDLLEKRLNEDLKRENVYFALEKAHLSKQLSTDQHIPAYSDLIWRFVNLEIKGKSAFAKVIDGKVGVWLGEGLSSKVNELELQTANFVIPNLGKKRVEFVSEYGDYLVLIDREGSEISFLNKRDITNNKDYKLEGISIGNDFLGNFYIGSEDELIRIYKSNQLAGVFVPIDGSICKPLFSIKEKKRSSYIESVSSQLSFAEKPFLQPQDVSMTYFPDGGKPQHFIKGVWIEKVRNQQLQ